MMFSASQSNPPSTGTRTRRRPLSNGSIAQPKAKRQRLTEETFLPPDEPEMEEVKHQKTPVVKNESLAPGPRREVAMRAKKTRTGERGNKGDGSTPLTSNDTYSVHKLVALPDRLRADATVRQHGAIYSDSGYALALTHTHAIVWPYAVNIPSPETFMFALPNSSKQASDPLPLGSLVSPSASSTDPGLVVVMPTSGKITYWESISSAATMDLRDQRNGVDFTVPGLFSGEFIIQVLNAESAGFVLAFSTGRTAYMSVRDGQGRPAISVQFLRGLIGAAKSSLFGSFRHVLSSTPARGNIAAVRAARPQKVGERNVAIATSKGQIQSWEVHRGGHTSMLAEVEGRETIVMAVKQANPSLNNLLLESFEIHDLTHLDHSSSEGGDQRYIDIPILLLVSLGERGLAYYFLVEVVLKHDQLDITDVRQIKSYTTPVSRTATSKPRLYLPNPGNLAFVVYDRAVVVISMAKPNDSPDSQLHSGSRSSATAFEDVVDFRKDMNVEIVGSGMEEAQGSQQGIEDTKSRRHRAQHAAVVLQVRGGGILRVAAADPKKSTTTVHQVTAKSKLEQAIFYGKVDQNPISFAVRKELQFSADEVGAAALSLSKDILKSITPHISDVPASLEQNIKKRAAALRELAEYLKASRVPLERVTKWQLLWDAERMAAANFMWKRYDSCIRAKAEGSKDSLLKNVVEWIDEASKTEPLLEAGELDRVRHWFIKDIWNLEMALPWAYQVIKRTFSDGQRDRTSLAMLMSEADDIVLSAMQGAFDFRAANLDLYGLGEEVLEHGILVSGYEGLPEFWTSTIFITENLRKQTDVAGALLVQLLKEPSQDDTAVAPVLEKLRHEFSDLIDITIRSSNERIRWDSVQENPVLQAEAEHIKSVLDGAQDSHIVLLAADCGLVDEAIELAEKHQILPTLAYILECELSESSARSHNSRHDSEQFSLEANRAEDIRQRVKHLFEKFGQPWANALFDFEIGAGSISDMLNGWPEQQKYLTTFLRSAPQYAKISWINDIVQEEDFDQASETLLDLGLKQEHHLWSKKIELSVGKLASLAGRSQVDGVSTPEFTEVHHQLTLIKIQDQVRKLVSPALARAIDESAGVDLALERYCTHTKTNQPFLYEVLLKESMAKVINHEAMSPGQLIDILTLMVDNGPSPGSTDPDEDEEIRAQLRTQVFYLALKAACCGLSKNDQKLSQRIIWRRCMLRDDWADVNNTEWMDDAQNNDRLRSTALYETFRACLKHYMFHQDTPPHSIHPREVLGAGVDELEQRFSSSDPNTKEEIRKDMQIEDDSLQPSIDTCQLERWFQSSMSLAKEDYEAELAAELMDGPNMRLAEAKLDEIENKIKANEQGTVDKLLHLRPRVKSKAKINGNAGGFRGSIKQY